MKKEKILLKNSFKKFALSLSLGALPLVLVTSCRTEESSSVTPSNMGVAISAVSTESKAIKGLNEKGYKESEDIKKYNFNRQVTIDFSGVSAAVDTHGIENIKVQVKDAKVVIESATSNIEYVVTGTTSDGMLDITSPSAMKITLKNANITNQSGSAIKISNVTHTFIEAQEGTTNILSDTANHSDEATLYSNGSLIFVGAGKLSIAGKKSDAVQARENIRISQINLNITESVNDGIQAGEFFVMESGQLDITTSPSVQYSKGISVLSGLLIINDGTINMKTSASAGIANQFMYQGLKDEKYSTIINGGNINITASNENISTEAIESNHGSVNINGGTLILKVTDDAINGETSVNVNGGKIFAYATKNDAVDSNGEMHITGGILVAGSTAARPETSMDSDRNIFNISGGIVVGISAGASPSSPWASTQSVLSLDSGKANEIIHLQDAQSKEVLTFLAPFDYTNMLISTPNLAPATTYKLFKGGKVNEAQQFNGLYTSGFYTEGNEVKTLTTESRSTASKK